MSRSSRIGGIYAECANNLKKQYGYNIVATKNFYYTGNNPQVDSEKWEETNFPVYDLNDEVKNKLKNLKKPAEQYVTEIEKKLGINLYASASNYLLYRRFSEEYYGAWDSFMDNEEDLVNDFVGSYMVLEDIFEKYKPDLIFYESIDLISTVIGFILARKNKKFAVGVNYIVLLGSGNFYFSYGTYRKNLLMNFFFKNSKIIDKKIYAKAKVLINKTHSGKIITAKNLLKTAEKLKKNSFFYYFVRIYKILYPTNLIKLFYIIKRIKLRVWLDRVIHYYPPNEKYVLFMMHKQPEASTSSLCPTWVDQEKIIEQLSIFAPYGVKIFVKEHMENYGQRPKNYYSNLEKLPNVYLIHPTVSNENLIRNTEAIVTISGSIGLEGIVSKKSIHPW